MYMYVYVCWTSLVAQMVKCACNVGDPGLIGKILWRRKWQPILVLFLDRDKIIHWTFLLLGTIWELSTCFLNILPSIQRNLACFTSTGHSQFNIWVSFSLFALDNFTTLISYLSASTSWLLTVTLGEKEATDLTELGDDSLFTAKAA